MWLQTIVGAAVQRRLRQRTTVSRALLIAVVDRIPQNYTTGVTYVLNGADRAAMLALIPEAGMTAPQTRSFLRLLRATAYQAFLFATYMFDLNDDDDSDNEGDVDPPAAPPRPRPGAAGKRGGRSHRRTNRRTPSRA